MTVAGPSWPRSTTGPLLEDDCGLDWIWDREGETRSPEENIEVADAAWRKQAAGIVARSPFYRERFAEARVDPSRLSSVTELAELPTMSKADTLATREKHPPFGGHLGVDPADVKRVYQTSGSSGRPSLIAMTNPDMETWTAIGARSYYATGIHPHHSVLTTFGAGPFVAGHTHWTLDRIGACRVPVGPGDLDRVLSACEAGIVDTCSQRLLSLCISPRYSRTATWPGRTPVSAISSSGENRAAVSRRSGSVSKRLSPRMSPRRQGSEMSPLPCSESA